MAQALNGECLVFIVPSQINYLVPMSTALGETPITVTSSDGTVSTGKVRRRGSTATRKVTFSPYAKPRPSTKRLQLRCIPLQAGITIQSRARLKNSTKGKEICTRGKP